ncbi:hypothetical protein [Allomeiothermus silvanus]|uniref:hypothetical protein n=1 Tax=Allomeiothermus silvanus TaxID=52022 RepID=UPI0023F46418|nr:hypothetical protein [Allomeiothermus silvanus]
MSPRRTLGKNLLRSKVEYGPNGRRLCRYIHCHNEVPRGRRTWCSDGCVHEYRLRSHWRYARDHLRRREKGICQLCGTDTRKLKSTLLGLWKKAALLCRDRGLLQNLHADSQYRALNAEYAQAAQELSQRGFHGFALELPRAWWPRKLWKEPADLWEADHILPVSEGGTTTRRTCAPFANLATSSRPADWSTGALYDGKNPLNQLEL